MTTAIASSRGPAPFSNYKPSQNAYADLSTPAARAKRQSQTGTEGVKTIHLKLPETNVKVLSPREQLVELFSAIPVLLAGQPTKQSFHHLCATCQRLVLPPNSLGSTIHIRIKEEIQKSASGLAREWRGSIMSREAHWLKKLVDGWRTWEARVSLLAAVFVYFDRVYANESSNIPSIRQLSIEAFRANVWENEVIFSKTRDEMLLWAQSERESETTSEATRPTIIALTALSRLLGLFPSLSKPYVEATTTYYNEQTSSNIDAVAQGSMKASTYVEWVLQKVEEEKSRAATCLSPDVAAHVVGVVRQIAGTQVSSNVVRPALDEVMDQTDTDALQKLYRFSVDVSVFRDFAQALQDHIGDRLQKLISDPANDPKMIDGTLTLKRFADRAVAELFSSDSADETPASKAPRRHVDKEIALAQHRQRIELEDAIRVGFKTGMGSRQNAPAEWIAKHLDMVMRRGQGSGTEAEFTRLLDEIIALIGFTKDKDVFKAFYSTQLAKRLLLNKSASDDMERNMIIKLQQEMGEEFTSGDIMMKDLQLSETLVKAYQSAQAKNPENFQNAGSFTANVLTESAWPAYPQLKDGWNFKLTPELQASIDAFTQWYSTQHQNRQLSWRYQLATVTMSARFDSGKYEMTLSLFQAVVLLQYNEEDHLTFKELQERTGIETSELKRTLQSLALGRKGTRVLMKKPPGKEVGEGDVFAYNKGFSSERIKFKINQIQQDMSAEESRKTNEQIIVDRVSVLEATIVRIMKARKKMTLQLLIDAVVTDVNKRFPPDVKEIKKRMESLIEREFLKRDDDDRNLLHYLA